MYPPYIILQDNWVFLLIRMLFGYYLSYGAYLQVLQQYKWALYFRYQNQKINIHAVNKVICHIWSTSVGPGFLTDQGISAALSWVSRASSSSQKWIKLRVLPQFDPQIRILMSFSEEKKLYPPSSNSSCSILINVICNCLY